MLYVYACAPGIYCSLLLLLFFGVLFSFSRCEPSRSQRIPPTSCMYLCWSSWGGFLKASQANLLKTRHRPVFLSCREIARNIVVQNEVVSVGGAVPEVWEPTKGFSASSIRTEISRIPWCICQWPTYMTYVMRAWSTILYTVQHPVQPNHFTTSNLKAFEMTPVCSFVLRSSLFPTQHGRERRQPSAGVPAALAGLVHRLLQHPGEQRSGSGSVRAHRIAGEHAPSIASGKLLCCFFLSG